MQWRTQDFADVYAHFVLCVCVCQGGVCVCVCVRGGGGGLPPHPTKKKSQGSVRTAFCAYF